MKEVIRLDEYRDKKKKECVVYDLEKYRAQKEAKKNFKKK